VSDTEFCNDCTITFDVGFHKVVKKVSSFTNHFEKAASGMVIFFVLFKMLGKVSNSFGKNSDLNFGGTGVGFVKSVSNDYFGFFFLSHHSDSPQKNFLLFGFFAGKGEFAFEATATGRFNRVQRTNPFPGKS
jgi:hypothetical protein